MKKIYLLILLTFQIAFASQAAEPDVSLNLLKKNLEEAKSDMSRLEANVDLGEYSLDNNLSGVHIYLDQAITIGAKLLDEPEGEINIEKIEYLNCKSYMLLGFSYYKQMYLSEAYALFDKVVMLAEVELEKGTAYDLQYENWRIESSQSMAYIDMVRGSSARAEREMKNAISSAQDMGLTEWEAKGYRGLGEMQSLLEKYEDSEESFIRSSEAFGKLGMANLSLSTKMDAGSQFVYLGEYDKALEIYEETRQPFCKQKNYGGFEAASYNMAFVYNSLGEYEQGIEVLLPVEDTPENINKADSYVLLSVLYLKDKQYDKAIEYAQKVKEEGIRPYGLEKRATADQLLSYVYLTSAQAKGELSSESPDAQEALSLNKKLVEDYVNNKTSIKSFGLLHKIVEADSLYASYRNAIRNENPDSIIKKELRDKTAGTVVDFLMTNSVVRTQQEIIGKQEDRLNSMLKRVAAIVLLFLITLLLSILLYLTVRRQRKANSLLREKNDLINQQQTEINQQIEKTNKLVEFREKMSNMIIHDLKTPLNGILNIKYIEDPELKDELVRHSANEMMNLVQNLLDFYKAQEMEMKIAPRVVVFDDLVKEEQLNIKFILDEKDLNVELVNPDSVSFLADEGLVSRVISNIFSNAAKYSTRKSTITVKAEIINKTDVRIGISNKGVVIPEDKKDYIFEPFGQINGGRPLGQATSTGLGLTFCKVAVEAHGGRIGVSSNEYETEFWFILPNSVVEAKEAQQ